MPTETIEERPFGRRAPLAALVVMMLAVMGGPAVFVPSLISEEWPLRGRAAGFELYAHRVGMFEDLPDDNQVEVFSQWWELPGGITYELRVRRRGGSLG